MLPMHEQGHVEAQAGATVRGQMASIRRAAEEREAELRRAMAAKEASAEEAMHRAKDRIAELEEEVTSLSMAVGRTEAESETLERRLRSVAPLISIRKNTFEISPLPR